VREYTDTYLRLHNASACTTLSLYRVPGDPYNILTYIRSRGSFFYSYISLEVLSLSLTICRLRTALYGRLLSRNKVISPLYSLVLILSSTLIVSRKIPFFLL
jgi:hypothetical protein